MKKIGLLLFILISFGSLDAVPLTNWRQNAVIKATARKPARTAVLIISVPLENSPTSHRWKLGKKVWEQYMNSHPDVDCYFVQCTSSRSGQEEVWIEGNTIYIGDPHYANNGDRILYKTIAAIECLVPDYTHFIRTNLNTFINLKNVHEYMETHHQSFYTAAIWQTEWYSIGYGILFTADVAAHIASEYRRLEKMKRELLSASHADDCVLTSLATGVNPLLKQHPFRSCPTLPPGVRQGMSIESFGSPRISPYASYLLQPITLAQAIAYCEAAPPTMMLYRTREGFTITELAQFYEYLLQKNYPELPSIDLVGYVMNKHLKL